MTRTDAGPVYVPEQFFFLKTPKVRRKAEGKTHVEHGEFREDRAELLIEGILCELDFAHVEVANATDFKVFVNDLRWLSVEDDKIWTITVNVRWAFSAGSWITQYPRSRPPLAPAQSFLDRW